MSGGGVNGTEYGHALNLIEPASAPGTLAEHAHGNVVQHRILEVQIIALHLLIRHLMASAQIVVPYLPRVRELVLGVV